MGMAGKTWQWQLEAHYTHKKVMELQPETLKKTGSLAIKTVHMDDTSLIAEFMATVSRDDIVTIKVKRIGDMR